jgi:hypothetical protein
MQFLSGLHARASSAPLETEDLTGLSDDSDDDDDNDDDDLGSIPIVRALSCPPRPRAPLRRFAVVFGAPTAAAVPQRFSNGRGRDFPGSGVRQTQLDELSTWSQRRRSRSRSSSESSADSAGSAIAKVASFIKDVERREQLLLSTAPSSTSTGARSSTSASAVVIDLLDEPSSPSAAAALTRKRPVYDRTCARPGACEPIASRSAPEVIEIDHNDVVSSSDRPQRIASVLETVIIDDD